MARRTAALLLSLALAAPALAQTRVDDAWARATVAQQLGTGAFMRLTSRQGGRLVAVQTPVARVAEVHEMVMQGDVMAMRAIEALELPPGKTVVLKPGGHHLMLMGLTQQLRAGDAIPLTLVIEGRDGRRETIEVKAAVRPLGAEAPKR